jgi:two-component system, response regulator, stage 0 sporulation protein F
MNNKLKVMYIDDEEINMQLFQIIFSKKYQILIGKSGMEGLKLLQENPDTKVVISDMKMPGMNGIEFITEARKTFDKTNYFILTGYNLTEEIKNAIDKNIIKKYFIKPMNFEEIESEIDSTITKGY